MTVDEEAGIWAGTVVLSFILIAASPLLLIFVWPIGCIVFPVWAIWRAFYEEVHR